MLASGMTVPPPVVRSRASRSCGSSARSRSRTRPGHLRVCGPEARLSPRRQRTVLHSPPTLLLPLRHGTRGRSSLGCRGRASRSCGSSARSCSCTRPGLRRVCVPQLASPPDGSAPLCIAPQPFFFRRSTACEAESRSAAAAAPCAAAGRARARARARGPALSGFAARSSPLSPTTACRPAEPLTPSRPAAARRGRSALLFI